MKSPWNNWSWESSRDYHWDGGSFGTDLPVNWEDVCSEANCIIDTHIEENPDESREEFREFLCDLWENAVNNMRVGAVDIIYDDEQ